MPVAALTAIVALAGVCWIVSIWQMNLMDMGVATQLGSFQFFIALWVVMMAAMMLPGAAPSVLKLAQVSESIRDVLQFSASYLAVWASFGVAVYVLYKTHSSFVAGVIVIAAGVYELTPLKRFFRERCCMRISGFEFGLCCMGSSVGLMLIMIALGIMSATWMLVVSALIVAQKFLPARAAIDVPLALMIVSLGVLIIIAPSSVPGLTPSI